jgi:hypothetical protein
MSGVARMRAELIDRKNYEPAPKVICTFRLSGIGIARWMGVHAPYRANIRQSSGLVGENSLSLLKDQRSERLEYFPRCSTKIRRLNEWILGLQMQSTSASRFHPSEGDGDF